MHNIAVKAITASLSAYLQARQQTLAGLSGPLSRRKSCLAQNQAAVEKLDKKGNDQGLVQHAVKAGSGTSMERTPHYVTVKLGRNIKTA